MATTTARTRADVDSMDKKDRLWDSLNYSYGLKREDSDKAYDQAYSQANRQALSRGMGRSSYTNQTLANLSNEKIKAQGNIWDAQIADYENRLGQLEQQDAEAERWEREFAANREDAAWNKEFQQKQADVSQNNWQLQFDAGRADADWQKQFQERQYGDTRADAERNWNFTQQQYADTRADADWQKQFQTQQYADSRTDADWQKSFQQQQYADSRADADWQKQFQTQQYADSRSDAERNWNFTQQQYADTRADAQRNWEFTQQQYADTRADTAWNQAFQTQQYADSRADTAWNQAFQQSQADLQRDQWERQFGYSQKTTEQQVAMQYAMSILQNGQMPSADLLASAGLSEADARAMMKQATGGGGNNGPKTTGDEHKDFVGEDGKTYTWDPAKGGYVVKVTQQSFEDDLNNGPNNTTLSRPAMDSEIPKIGLNVKVTNAFQKAQEENNNSKSMQSLINALEEIERKRTVTPVIRP